MPTYKTDRPFSDTQLKAMDIIHDPDTTLFTDQNEESYTVDEFIDDRECDQLRTYFKDHFDRIGYNINNHVLHITYPMLIPEISDMVRPKVLE